MSRDDQQRHTFTMWLNNKLTKADYSAVDEENLGKEFKNGIVIHECLKIFTGKGDKIKKDYGKIDKHPRFAIQEQNNLSILWQFMTKEEKIDLSGVNIPNIHGEREKTVLNLIWRWYKKYGDVTPQSEDDEGPPVSTEIIEWVNSRIQTNYRGGNDVNGWGDHSWKDGSIFLQLFDSICQPWIDPKLTKGPDIADITVCPVDVENAEANLQLAFDLFENKLHVPQMMKVEFFKNKPDKNALNMYVGELRVAILAYEATRRKMIDIVDVRWAEYWNNVNNGDNSWQQGDLKQSKKLTSIKKNFGSYVLEFVNNIRGGGGSSREYEEQKRVIFERFTNEITGGDSGFDFIIECFDNARTEYAKVPTEGEITIESLRNKYTPGYTREDPPRNPEGAEVKIQTVKLWKTKYLELMGTALDDAITADRAEREFQLFIDEFTNQRDGINGDIEILIEEYRNNMKEVKDPKQRERITEEFWFKIKEYQNKLVKLKERATEFRIEWLENHGPPEEDEDGDAEANIYWYWNIIGPDIPPYEEINIPPPPNGPSNYGPPPDGPRTPEGYWEDRENVLINIGFYWNDIMDKISTEPDGPAPAPGGYWWGWLIGGGGGRRGGTTTTTVTKNTWRRITWDTPVEPPPGTIMVNRVLPPDGPPDGPSGGGGTSGGWTITTIVKNIVIENPPDNLVSFADLLKIYHEWSYNIETQAFRGIGVEKVEIPKDASEVRQRMDMILQQVINFVEMEDSMRDKVQKGVDDVFDDANLKGVHWSRARLAAKRAGVLTADSELAVSGSFEAEITIQRAMSRSYSAGSRS
jgi:hypothetical protein